MKRILLIVIVSLLSYRMACPCSSAIVSGRATPDGRPLLWKHRDAREQFNDLRFFQGEKYNFIGLVNTNDTTGTQVWMGSNAAGFSIANTNSYNLDKGNMYKGKMDLEGYFMKEALGRCGTLGDFEKMLDATRGNRGTLTNFVVLDAQGGAAYYETSPETYIKFDVNDASVAPQGYLIRTNFAMSGDSEQRNGYIRYDTLEHLFSQQHLNGKISVDFILLDATRCLKHSLLETDLARDEIPDDATNPTFVFFRDYIVRSSSVSTMVIQGVKAGEDPKLTTLWTIPAFQLSSLTVPVWIGGGENLPSMVTVKSDEPSPISTYSLLLKQRCFPLPLREGRSYLNHAAVMNKSGSGILQQVHQRDKAILQKAHAEISKWRREGFSQEEAQKYYDWLDEYILNFYRDNFTFEDKGYLKLKELDMYTYSNF